MAKTPATIKKPPVFRSIFLQCIFIAALAAWLYLWRNDAAGYSALLGGVIATVPNAWFAWRAFRYNGTRHADRVVSGFYLGEAGKFALVAILFALVFKLVSPLHAGALFGAFIATLLVGICASVWTLPRQQMKSQRDTQTRDT